jgi:RNA polymerase sigma-70 factor (ECF subfamily)
LAINDPERMSDEAPDELEHRLRELLRDGHVSKAVELLHRVHEEEIRRFVRRRVADPPSCEDVCQEIWGAVGAGLGRFRADARARTWLLRIAYNKVADFHRTRHGQPVMDAESSGRIVGSIVRSGPGPSTALRERERAERVRAALEGLSAEDRDLLLMRFAEDLRPREIAEILPGDVKPNTISQRILAATRRLRSSLEADEGFEV